MAVDGVAHCDDERPAPGARRLSVDAQASPGALHVRLSGDLDLSSAAAFRREMHRLEARDPATMRLDLGGLDFIDSTGLRLVAELYRRCLAARRVLWLTPARPAVQRMFEVTLLDQTLPFAEPPAGLARPAQSPPD